MSRRHIELRSTALTREARLGLFLLTGLLLACDPELDSSSASGKDSHDTGRPDDSSETADTTDSGDTEDTGETADTEDTGETADSGETGDTADSEDTGETADSGETGETADTSETGDTGDTGDTAHTGATADTADTAEMAVYDVDAVSVAKLNGEGYGDGESLAALRASDLDGDATPELLGSAHGYESAGSSIGAVYVSSGATLGSGALSASWLVIRGGEEDALGWDANATGDANGDGFADLVIGATGHDSTEVSGSEGGVYLFNGPFDGTETLETADAFLQGEPTLPDDSNQTGRYVDFAGDVDGDGDDELLFSAAYLSVAYVVRGPVAATVDLATEADVRITTSGQQGDVSGIGDQDGDGLDDIVISDQGDDNARVMMFMGPLGDSLVTADADASFAHADSLVGLGLTLAGAGDTNGDGYVDVVVGACCDGTYEYQAGAAFILTGPMSGTYDLETDNIKIRGEERLGNLGTWVDRAGDIDGDGFADVVLGAPRLGSSTDYVIDGPGATYVAFGPFAGTPLISEVGLRIDGTGDDQLGSSVAGIGDLDGDGFDDIATVGAGDDDGGADAGAIWIIPGAVLLR